MTAESRLIRCRSFGGTNRVPNRKVEAGRQPICGRCKTPLRVGPPGRQRP